jgi:hypothetical protein
MYGARDGDFAKTDGLGYDESRAKVNSNKFMN